jgi:hypothetical protein
MSIPGFNSIIYMYFLWLGSFRLGRNLLLEDPMLVLGLGGTVVSMEEAEATAIGTGGATPRPTICITARHGSGVGETPGPIICMIGWGSGTMGTRETRLEICGTGECVGDSLIGIIVGMTFST